MPEKKYCAEDYLNFRILLILDNASAHVLDYLSLSEDVKIMYMPPRTVIVMQLMDQDVIRALESYILCYISVSSLVHNGCSCIMGCWETVSY
jgi:hypothetical protein